jgi:hypothetical protein
MSLRPTVRKSRALQQGAKLGDSDRFGSQEPDTPKPTKNPGKHGISANFPGSILGPTGDEKWALRDWDSSAESGENTGKSVFSPALVYDRAANALQHRAELNETTAEILLRFSELQLLIHRWPHLSAQDREAAFRCAFRPILPPDRSTERQWSKLLCPEFFQVVQNSFA